MYNSLSEIQKRIVNQRGLFVVRACPGSGKTYTVAARLVERLKKWEKKNSGIAALSFTNVAWQEIERKIKENSEMSVPICYPHYLGTIDSFINNYIFLPFGHLVMGCKNRPIMVGEPFGSWTKGNHERDYDLYFPNVSLGINEKLEYPKIPGLFFFGYNKLYCSNGQESQHAINIRNMKKKYWNSGYASQKDATYFSFKLLERFPDISKIIVKKFPELIIDEAQDTSELHMLIIDLLIENGLKELVLVGDPDQAIFEWNNARPELFNIKFNEWHENSISLNVNRRSSQAICDATFKLSSLPEISEAISKEVKNFDIEPELEIFIDDNLISTIDKFLNKVNELCIEINTDNVAIIVRSKSSLKQVLGLEEEKKIWTFDSIYTKDIIQCKYLFDFGNINEAMRKYERVCFKIEKNQAGYSLDSLKEWYNSVGIVKLRKKLYHSISTLPRTNTTIDNWVNQANKVNIKCDPTAKGIFIDKVFSSKGNTNELKYRLGTVHSVKGETFEAVLLILKSKGLGKSYKTLIKENISITENEELRIVYVGITRPRKYLMIAVPDEENLEAWKKKFS